MEQSSASPIISPAMNGGSVAQNKTVSSSKEITKNLIVNWLIWYIIFNIIYSVIANYLLSLVGSSLIQIIVSIVLQALIVFCAWVLSTKFTFNNRYIAFEDVRVVVKRLVIFSIVICIVNGVYQFVQAESTFNNSIDSNYALKVKERQMEKIYSAQEMSEYNKQKSEAIAEAKQQMYVDLAIVELVSIIVFLGIIPIERKMIMKHVLKNNNITTPSVPSMPSTPPMVS